MMRPTALAALVCFVVLSSTPGHTSDLGDDPPLLRTYDMVYLGPANGRSGIPLNRTTDLPRPGDVATIPDDAFKSLSMDLPSVVQLVERPDRPRRPT